jgi:hypothetical protein
MSGIVDNMQVSFRLLIPKEFNGINNVVGQPIISNDDHVIGIITEAEVDDSKLYYNCKGVILETSLVASLLSESLTEDKYISLCSIEIV